jgi:hypothetical protein
MNQESSVNCAGLTDTNITQKKGLAIMHHIEPVIIWFFFVTMGMVLTLVMTVLAATPRRHALSQDASVRIATYHLVPRPEGVAVPVTSMAQDTASITSDREATVPPRAA